ncbi:hypothetical protein DRN74_03480 [Candidatus Micrarchaeota archaeon]|nr:MAG: hypothetical protein DRN74_03480 [Candidatus Micrarchaeota archaeon]
MKNLLLAALIIGIFIVNTGCISYFEDVKDYFSPYIKTVMSKESKPAGGPCDYDGDCNSWEYCDSHICKPRPGFCNSIDDCEEWQRCSEEHRCVLKPSRCNSDLDCPLARPHCDEEHYCNR